MKEIRSLKLKIAPEVRSATHCVMSSSTGLLVRCAMSRAVGQRAEDAPCRARVSNSRSRADRCSGSARATSLGAGTAGSRGLLFDGGLFSCDGLARFSFLFSGLRDLGGGRFVRRPAGRGQTGAKDHHCRQQNPYLAVHTTLIKNFWVCTQALDTPI